MIVPDLFFDPFSYDISIFFQFTERRVYRESLNTRIKHEDRTNLNVSIYVESFQYGQRNDIILFYTSYTLAAE